MVLNDEGDSELRWGCKGGPVQKQCRDAKFCNQHLCSDWTFVQKGVEIGWSQLQCHNVTQFVC